MGSGNSQFGNDLQAVAEDRGRKRKSTKARNLRCPARHERRSFDENVRNLPVVAGTKRLTLFQDSHRSASSCSTRECAGAAV
jgi:hypothetical protein